MEGLFPFLIIIGIVNAIIKWAKKQQAAGSSSNQGSAPDKPWQRMLGELSQTIDESVSGKTPVKTAQPAQVYRTLKTPIVKEGTGSGEGGAFPGSIAYRQTPYITGGESAASPYSLQSEGVSNPQEPLPQWRGSLPGTMESVSFTAKAADTSLVTEPVQEARPVLNLAFNRDTLLQAIVMREILARPQDRRRRGRPH